MIQQSDQPHALSNGTWREYCIKLETPRAFWKKSDRDAGLILLREVNHIAALKVAATINRARRLPQTDTVMIFRTLIIHSLLATSFAVCIAERIHAEDSQGPSVGVVNATSRDKRVFHKLLHVEGTPVAEIIFYSSPTGAGGNFRLQNMTGQDRKYRIRVMKGDGRTENRIVHADSRAWSGAQSFSSAGTQKAGIDDVTLIYSKVK